MEWLEPRALNDLRLERSNLLSQGKSILDLSMINPDLQPPKVLVDRLVEASISDNIHRYSASRGISRLRESCAEKYLHAFDVSLNPENVCHTFGTKDAFNIIFSLIREKGKAVLLPSPTYNPFLYACYHAGLPYEFYQIGPEEEMISGIERALKTGRFSAIVLNFPNNPTNLVVSRNFYEKLAKVINHEGILVINDFVYGEMVTKEESVSLLSIDALQDFAVETYSLSKSYCIPGWRTCLVSARSGDGKLLVGQMARVKSLVDFGNFLALQVASSYALSSHHDLAAPARTTYLERGLKLANLLKEYGFTVPYEQKTPALWAKLPRAFLSDGDSSLEFAFNLLRAGIAISPGSNFGTDYHEYVRFALVEPLEKFKDILTSFLSVANAR